MASGIEHGQQIDLATVEYEFADRWTLTGVRPWELSHVDIGTLHDGRWWVRLVADINRPARAYSTQAHARAVAANLMRWRLTQTGTGTWAHVGINRPR